MEHCETNPLFLLHTICSPMYVRKRIVSKKIVHCYSLLVKCELDNVIVSGSIQGSTLEYLLASIYYAVSFNAILLLCCTITVMRTVHL